MSKQEPSKPEKNKIRLHDKMIDIQAKFEPDSLPYAICEDVIEDLGIEGGTREEPFVPELKNNEDRLAAIASHFVPESPHARDVRDAQDLLSGKQIRRRLQPVQHQKIEAPQQVVEETADQKRARAINLMVQRGKEKKHETPEEMRPQRASDIIAGVPPQPNIASPLRENVEVAQEVPAPRIR
jgi:hypothetical protein